MSYLLIEPSFLACLLLELHLEIILLLNRHLQELHNYTMSRLVGKPTMWFPNRSDTKWAVQSQKQARSLYYPSRNCTIPVAKTKALISFAVTAKLICAFVFAYADCWFFHGAAPILVLLIFICKPNVKMLTLKALDRVLSITHWTRRHSLHWTALRDTNMPPHLLRKSCA